MLEEGAIAVIKADDPIHFFFLVKITKKPFCPDEFKDDYGHTYNNNHIILGNYLETDEEDGDMITIHVL